MTIRSSAALAVPNITETEDDGLNANYHGDPPMSSRQSPRHALDTDEHRAGRVIRGVDWVVWVETAEAKWIELDAHSAINAETLATNWIRPQLGARGASVRSVRLPSGQTTFRKLFTPPTAFDDEEVA
jgi:hypothetical protein